LERRSGYIYCPYFAIGQATHSRVIPRLSTGVAVATAICLELARSVCSMKLVACHSSFERMEKFKYLGTTLTNQNSVREEIKCILKSGNACHHSVQNLLKFAIQIFKEQDIQN
jgi:hypothetical protein